MKKILFTILCLLSCSALLLATDIYVSASTGNNSNDGSMASPLKNIEKAIGKAAAGDSIHVAEGNYFGLRGKGLLVAPFALKIYGGYSPDFSERDILKYQTKIQPTNASAAKSRKPLLAFKKSKAGDQIVVDGLFFDAGLRNSYHDKDGKPEGLDSGMLLLPPASNRAKKDKPTVTEPLISFSAAASAGDVLITNCIFINGANFAIQGGHKAGDFKVLNNVFVSNRMAAIEIYGTGGKKGPKGPTEKDGDVEIANNTILFTWSRMKDFKDMGYGVRVMTKLSYNIHHNILGMAVLTAIDHTRFNKDEWLTIENNMFLLNKQAELMYSEAGINTLERVMLDEFGDLEFASTAGNTDKLSSKLPINEAYLTGFLSARYSEEVDYDPDSSANVMREVMGMNKQGKLKTKVSMFGNYYPLEDAVKLFGALEGYGAKLPAVPEAGEEQ